jgi:CHRD domain/PEP-CTERM motif
MNKSILRLAAAAAMLAGATSAQAITYTFNAALSSANEVAPVVSTATATGIAILAYDTKNTASVSDDTYDFSMAVFGLTGGTVPGTAARAFHIHGAASTTENGPVRVNLDAAPFVFANSGSTLLVGGDDIAVAPVGATASNPLTPNSGYLPMSFLDMLRGGLAYVNVHTDALRSGAVRGQLIEVSAVPEASTYAMLLTGLGVVGFMARRRRQS